MAKLNIIRASAGSGKTYTLTEEYLKLAFINAESFRHILAVTFTNKATAEMKNRLIDELHKLSAGKDSRHLEKLKISLNLSEDVVRNKATLILQKILHDYSHFFVGTIDSFFQRIIRSFTREIGIQSGYTIELDAESILDEAIDRLQTETTTNKTLLYWLTEFAMEKIEKGNTWNFRKDIAKLGQQLFNEQFKTFSLNLSDKISDKKFMNGYQQELFGIRKKFESTIRELASKGIDKIRAAGLDAGDFYQTRNGPAGFLYKASAGNIPEPNSYVRQATIDITGWHAKNSIRIDDIKEICHAGLFELLQEIVNYYDRESRSYHTAGQIMKNLYALGILTDLSIHLRNYCQENNVFLLSEASSFLNAIIDNNDTPFVYEKTGNHFHHFMIDEFQDTSRLQWNNFKPLISNSLSQDYDSLIVGDVKQSIYRWRNSSWEILAHAVDDEFYEQSLSFNTLRHNHRSCIEMIHFNNTFFQRASRMLQDHFDHQTEGKPLTLPDNLRQAIVRNFDDAIQVPGQTEKAGGQVRISFLDKNEFKSAMEGKLIRLINELLEKGYAAGDIAILTRKNEEATSITDFILRQKNTAGSLLHPVDVISDETLYLSNSSVVCFLMGIIRYLHSPEDSINKYYIINEYLSYLRPCMDNNPPHEFIEPVDFTNVPLTSVFPESVQQLIENAGNFSLFELVENLISLFRLNSIIGESIYLQAFQDQILDFSNRESPSVADFIDFWEERGQTKPVALTGSHDAIRVLTIHKAKGLEFPVVILPYCKWELVDQVNRPIIWCKPGQSPFNKLNIVPVEFTSRLVQTYFADVYFEELVKQYIDTINLLYVAFTRASKALFCFSPKPDSDRLITLSDLFKQLFQQETVTDETNSMIHLADFYRSSDQVFEYGQLLMNKKIEDQSDSTTTIPNHYPASDARDKLKVAYQGKIFLETGTGQIKRSVSDGRLMHEVFSRIYLTTDIPVVVSSMAMEGKIATAESADMITNLQGLFADVQVASWFSGDWKIMTETEFILPGGIIRRPDRVLIKDDKAIVIDYKFGKNIEENHKKQILEYRQLLIDMGYRNSEAWLWYVILNEVVQVG
ncbi:MAG: UvrD-helicase domain-containing protein [Bacteroidales bacterium]|nr:UvrD-helicase domain-containing protein [Bacteroidales bacterium]